jgi:hypothetical protein
MPVFDRWCSAQQRAGPSKPPTTTARGWVHRTHIRLIREVGPRHVTPVMATAIAYLKRVLRVTLVHAPLVPSEEAKNLHRAPFSDIRLLAPHPPSQ